MRTGRVTAALIAPIIAIALAGGAAVGRSQHAVDAPSNTFAGRLLALHNQERDRIGISRLAWSSKLSGEAQQWAQVLAREGRMRHASQAERGAAGENLWMGAAGYYGPDVMIGAFANERRHFVNGALPDVSRTGNWRDVGHYTQVVWRETSEVGCAIARGERDDFLVCRYWPAGNWMGQKPF